MSSRRNLDGSVLFAPRKITEHWATFRYRSSFCIDPCPVTRAVKIPLGRIVGLSGQVVLGSTAPAERCAHRRRTVGTRRNLLPREIVVQNVKSSQPRVDPNLIQPEKWPFVEGIWVISVNRFRVELVLQQRFMESRERYGMYPGC
jgi:hypothetical protein